MFYFIIRFVAKKAACRLFNCIFYQLNETITNFECGKKANVAFAQKNKKKLMIKRHIPKTIKEEY